jgi:hypothetical protein
MPVLILLAPARLIALSTPVSLGGETQPLPASCVKVLLLAFAQMPKYKLPRMLAVPLVTVGVELVPVLVAVTAVSRKKPLVFTE